MVFVHVLPVPAGAGEVAVPTALGLVMAQADLPGARKGSGAGWGSLLVKQPRLEIPTGGQQGQGKKFLGEGVAGDYSADVVM